MLGEEALRARAGRAAQHAQRAVDNVRQNPIGDLGVEVGKALFGGAALGPEDALRMRESHLGVALAGCLGGLRCGLENDLLWRLVLAQSLERGRTQHPVARPLAKLDLSNKPRLDPHDALLGTVGQYIGERRLLRHHLLERPAQHPRLIAGPARSDPARIMQRPLRVVAERERPHRMAVRGRRHVTENQELLPIDAFRLEPMVAAPGPVGQILALGDDAFEAEAAGMLQHGRPVRLHMVTEGDRQIARQTSEDLPQQVLAVDQSGLAQIEAFAIKNVEDEVAKAVLPAAAEIGLQIVEARDAVRVFDHDLAVEQRRGKADLLDRRGDARKALGPIERLAGQELHLATVDARLHAIAIVLDLMDPFGPARRLLAGRSEAWLLELRQQLLARALDLADVGKRALARLGDLAARRMIGPHIACGRQLIIGATAEIGGGFLIRDLTIARMTRELVLRLHQEPRLGLLALARLDAHQMPQPLEPRAVEHEREMPLLEPELRVPFGHPFATVPHDHGAATILALGDVALEFKIVDRMVLGAHRKPLLAERQARAAGDRPALEHAIELEPQIVVQPPRGMLLDNEFMSAARAERGAGLRRAGKIALLRIAFERFLGLFLPRCHGLTYLTMNARSH